LVYPQFNNLEEFNVAKAIGAVELPGIYKIGEVPYYVSQEGAKAKLGTANAVIFADNAITATIFKTEQSTAKARALADIAHKAYTKTPQYQYDD
jgi:hypothetical protein